MKQIKNKYFINTLFNFIFRLINMAITYITVPLTLKYLSNERYGIWQTILTIISWAALTNFGIGNGLRNKVTESITSKNNKKLKGYISSAYIYLSAISLIILIIGIFMTLIINTNTLFRMNTISKHEIVLSLIIVIISFCVNFVLGISGSIAYGIHKSSIVNCFQTITSVFTLIGLILLKMLTKGNLINISLLYLFANSISNMGFTILIFINKKFRPSLKAYDKKLGIELTSLGLEFFILQLAMLVLFSTDNFIISIFIGVGKVTNYSIASKLFQIISTVFSILLIQLWSLVAEATYKKNFKWIRNAINRLLILLIPTIAVIIIMIIKFNLITRIWLGKPLLVDEKLIILCAAYAVLICFNGIFTNVQNGMEKIRIQTVSSVISCILNIPLSIFFIEVIKLDVVGVMLSNVICLLISSIICSIDVYFKLYRKVNKR